MPLRPGSHVGVYEIEHAIGAGGMGEVYQARDTKLRRHVAIKTLPEAMARDPDRLARLEREAELLASLNHPNIAVIHGLEEHDGTRFLVLELIEGGTLEDRLVRGPLSVKEALEIALKIAEALEAAHEKGVVHRDLKPANVKVTPEGRVKVLDFGLAKSLGPVRDDAVTQTAMATQPGIAVGTPAYMSPEQARGEATGPQTDIWSFGAVMYELLTGMSPFKQNTSAETLAKLLETEPDYAELPATTPASVRRLIRRCLEKERKQRLQNMGDVRLEIDDALAGLGSRAPQDAGKQTSVAMRLLAAGALTLAAIAALSGWFLAGRSRSVIPAAAARLSIAFFSPLLKQPYGVRRLAISEDGSRVAYSSRTDLFIRRIDRKDPVSVTNFGMDPIFSPDGHWVAFFNATGLIKAPVDGGPPVLIAATSARPGGATWRADGTIVFATSEGLFQVSQDSGQSRLLMKPDRSRKERVYAWPTFLPGGRSVLFTIVSEDAAEGNEIALLELETLDRRIVLKGGSAPQYVRSGHLVYAAGPVLKAVAFDADAGQVLGDPISLPEVEIATAADNGAADFALSATGTLVFISSLDDGPLDILEWIDRSGKKDTVGIEPGIIQYPRVSPDGTRAALDLIRGGNRDIWILNFERLSLTRLTDGPTEDLLPVWSPDGSRVFFASNRTGNFDVYSQPADGATGPRVEFTGPGTQMPQGFTSDGTQLIVYDEFRDTSVLDLTHAERLTPLLHGDADERLGKVSPDGHWIVYESDEAGKQFEIFLRPFPQVSDRREKISIDGGRYPLWGPKGSDELYYVTLAGDMMAASIKLSPALKLGPVTKLFDYLKPPPGRSGIPYDVSSDGRFLTTRPLAADTQTPTQVSVVLNWLDELQRLIPRR